MLLKSKHAKEIFYFSTEPKDFQSKLTSVSCVVECEDQLLLLKRNSNRTYGGKWGFPTGKQELNETIEDTAIRELYEETNISISATAMHYCGKRYVRYADQDFEYHLLYVKLPSKPVVKLRSREHQDYTWATSREILNMDYIEDLDTCLNMLPFSPNNSNK